MMFLPEDHRLLGYGPRTVAVDHRRWKPNVELAPNCPRCDSSNTKFCYYNNYSLTQPRYFCKGCRRYWTKGGSLRYVPVGGGCRKNRRGKSARLSCDPTTSSSRPGKGQDSGLRPDLALDDMFVSHPRPDAGGGGSTIDMAALYARYLNQAPEALSEAGGSFGPVGSGGPNGAAAAGWELLGEMGELGVAVRNGLLPEMSGEVLNGADGDFTMSFPANPNSPWPAAAAEQDLGGLPAAEEIVPNHHYLDLMIGDWGSMDQAGFEAF